MNYIRTGLEILVLSLFGAAMANADMIKISSINGNYNTQHVQVIDVHPGDVISLSADVFSTLYDGSGNILSMTAQNRYVEDFAWSESDRPDTPCLASDAVSCQNFTNFEVTDYGVNFYVPYDIGNQVSVSVRFAASSFPSNDMIVLRNVDAAYGVYTPPATVITDINDYNYNVFSPDYALAGQGRWVYVNGMRYFVPYRYSADWMPNQNGYWAWAGGEYTWMSYDPWGSYTDHYGYWRHHENYGWMWCPFEDRVYRPHVVAWFYTDGYVGWYPYATGYERGYRDGFEQGFDDGYWAGVNAHRFYGQRDNFNRPYYPGVTIVQVNNFTNVNIYSVREVNQTIVTQNIKVAVVERPTREVIESHAGRIQETTVNVRNVGGVNVSSPAPIAARPVPPAYRQAAGAANVPSSQPGVVSRPAIVPIGSVVTRGSDPAKPNVAPPTTNNRGIATPPQRAAPASGGQPVVMAPPSRDPGKPNSSNPVNTAPRPAPAAPVTRPENPGGQTGSGTGSGSNRPAPAPAPRPQPSTPETPARPGPSDPNNHPGTQPGAQPGSQPGTRPGTQPGTQPGQGQGTRPGTQPPGQVPVTKPPTEPQNPGTRPGAPVTRPPTQVTPRPSEPSGGGQQRQGGGGTSRPAPPSGGGQQRQGGGASGGSGASRPAPARPAPSAPSGGGGRKPHEE